MYCNETKRGGHCKTAEFWMNYTNFMHLYHSFNGSVKSGDLELYVSCLPQITNCFFIMNHVNYARWSVKYYDSLLKLPESHPEVYNDFKKGWFGVKRTKKSFSATPIDLTLEQTINADAASQKVGITALTNSISARQRWAESHFLHTSIISSVLDQVGIRKNEDSSQYLRLGTMKKDNEVLHNVINLIQDTMSPFDDIEKQHLYNIATGKSVSTETENFLLNIQENGEKARKKFIEECVENPKRFEEPISRQKITNICNRSMGKRK